MATVWIIKFERTLVGTPYRVALSVGAVTGTELDVAHVFLTGDVGLMRGGTALVRQRYPDVPPWVIWPCRYRKVLATPLHDVSFNLLHHVHVHALQVDEGCI